MAVKIIFFGNERIATDVVTTTPTIKTLVESGFELRALVVNNEKALSRKHRELEIESYALTQKIPIFKPKKLSDIAGQLRELNADIGVLVAYGKIIPQSIIDIFPHGIVNIHPSLLPLHRGSTPIESVILNGAKETGVSIMSLVSAMDAGPVYSQVKVLLTGGESKQQLANELIGKGSEQLSVLLSAIVNGTATPSEQNHEKATYDEQIQKADGDIDWFKPAIELEREIRAYTGWPQSRTKLGDIEVIITSAHVIPSNFGNTGDITIEEDDNTLMVQTADGSFCIDRLKPAGKKEMDIAGFINGYKNRLGF